MLCTPYEQQRRLEACWTCDRYHADRSAQWCDMDDIGGTYRNCSRSKHGRFAGRLGVISGARCEAWQSIKPQPACACPVCLRDDPISRGLSHVLALRELCDREMPPPPGLHGEGIVYAYTGGLKFWPMVVVAVKLMREIGIQTKIQVWADEWGTELSGVANLEIIDLKQHVAAHQPRRINRFAIKDYAIAHSGFEKTFFLDCDAYLVRDPAPLFALLNEVPFAYWSDFDRNMIKDWSLLGGPPRRIPNQLQGGHILVNLRTAWKVVMVSRWYNDHNDFWWRQFPWHDESGWCVALTQTGSDYKIVEPCRWERFGFGSYYQGEQYIVHRVRCKLLAGEGRTAHGAPYESRVMELFRELIPPPIPDPPAVRRTKLRSQRQRILARRRS